MKRKLKKIPYTHRIALAILLFSLLPCVLLASFYLKNALSDWKKEVLINYQNDTDSAAVLMSKTATEFQAKMLYLLNNYEIRAYLSKIEALSISQALDMITTMNEAVASVTAGSPDMVVRWYPMKSPLSYGNYSYTLERFVKEFPEGTEDADYLDILSLKDSDFLWKVRKIAREADNKGTPTEMLCLYSLITDLYGKDCVLEFSIPVTSLVSSSKNFTPVSDSLFAICLEQEDNPLDIVLSTTLNAEAHKELLLQYHHSKSVPGYEIVRSEISNTKDSEVIYLIPESYVTKLVLPKISGFISISLLVACAILGTCYLTSYFLTRKITHAVNTLTTDLSHILTDPVHSDYRGNDEINQIVLQVRKLIQDTSEYCIKIERYEAETLRMELELLQMRFNPHLLYNTLDAINHQVRNPLARNSIESLCSYYRIVLNNGYLIIRIEDEIDMIKKYLSIVKFTYGLDDVTYEFEIEEQIKQYTIIKHLLQPIVENALNHGIRPTGHGGTLCVHAYETEMGICIQIKDNGVGMTAEKTKSLLEAPSASVQGGGYGIYNVQQRIQVYYGKEYGLQIDSSPEGTTVTMCIPKRLEEG